jgi:hypothetical protein
VGETSEKIASAGKSSRAWGKRCICLIKRNKKRFAPFLILIADGEGAGAIIAAAGRRDGS